MNKPLAIDPYDWYLSSRSNGAIVLNSINRATGKVLAPQTIYPNGIREEALLNQTVYAIAEVLGVYDTVTMPNGTKYFVLVSNPMPQA